MDMIKSITSASLGKEYTQIQPHLKTERTTDRLFPSK